MNLRLRYVLAPAAGILVLAILAVFGLDALRAWRDQQGQAQANQAHGEAVVHQAQAQAHDAAIPAIDAKVKERDARIAKLLAEREALLATIQTLGSATPGPDPRPQDDPRDAVIAKDAVIIEEQKGAIADRDRKIAEVTAARDEWRATAGALTREVAGLRQVIAARPAPRNWSAGVRLERRLDGTGQQLGATARRDFGPAYIEASGFSDRAGLGFGWRF